MAYHRTQKIRLLISKTDEDYLQGISLALKEAWNWLIDTDEAMYDACKKDPALPKPSSGKLYRAFEAFREEINTPWTRAIKSAMMSALIMKFCVARNKWFHGNGKPTKKAPSDRDSFECDAVHQKIVDGKLHFARGRLFKLAEPLKYSGKMCMFTYLREAGSWYLLIEWKMEGQDTKPAIDNDKVVGIDLGIANSITLSTGEVYQLPDVSFLEERLLKQKTKLRCSKVGSKNHDKFRRRAEKTQERINHIMTDAIHKITSEIASRFSVVVMEKLSIVGMVEQTKHARFHNRIYKARMGRIKEYLVYKTNVFEVDQYYPSSQICSTCGAKHKMTLKDRTFHCEECGTVIDRDKNAALNLRAAYFAGLAKPVVRCKAEGV